jgi:hypothetical protein
MNPHFVPIDHDRMELIADYLRRPARIEKAYSDPDITWSGTPGSVSQSERAYRGPIGSGPDWSREVGTAFMAARLLLIGMADQMLSVARIISDPELGPHGLLGIEVCCRSAIEFGARGWWLMDPDLSARNRVSRYFVDQLYSAGEAEALEANMGWPPSRTGSPSTAALLARCQTLGLAIARRNGRYVVDGQIRRGSTSLVTELVDNTRYGTDSAMVYPLMSATTHGTFYALMRSYRATEETLRGDPVLWREADHRLIEAPAGVALACFSCVIDRAVALNGWSSLRADSFKTMLYSMLGDGPR